MSQSGNKPSAGLCSRRVMMQRAAGALVGGPLLIRIATAAAPQEALLGYWPLQGDAQDHSGNGLHGREQGAARQGRHFDGRSSYIEILHGPKLDLGRSNFTIAAWIKADDAATDITGDVIGKWDPETRKGFTLCVKGSSGGYNSHGSERNVHFGIDDADLGEWQDCGRPNPTSNYVSNSLTVFDGGLYAATTDAAAPEDWCHVYRYAGGDQWLSCGRVGDRKTQGVGPLVVHNGQLYAATWSYDWTRVNKLDLDTCRVYRYAGEQKWVDCGQPGECRRLFGMASFGGRLYVNGDDLRVWVSEGDGQWTPSREFRSLVHPMAVHDGKLCVGEFGIWGPGKDEFRPAVVSTFDGSTWSAGAAMVPGDRENQVHALHVYQGKLHATTWPNALVRALEPNGEWVPCGRLGESTESNAMCVYNGMLYAGTIPRGEVYRFDGGTEWTRVGRFCPKELAEASDPSLHDRWGRVTSLTPYGGRLFASVGSYTSSIQDGAADQRGRVYSLRAGHCVSYDRDLGGAWRHLTAVRKGNRLALYLDGKLVSESDADSAGYDLSNTAPLRIGFGPTDFFSGSIAEVRLWKAALEEKEIASVAAGGPPV